MAATFSFGQPKNSGRMKSTIGRFDQLGLKMGNSMDRERPPEHADRPGTLYQGRT